MDSMIGIFCTSFVVALSGALMPGPLLTTTVGESIRHGARAGPLLMAGHALLEIALVALLFLGLAPFLVHPAVTAVVGVLGGGILCYLAYDMFRSLPHLSIDMKAGAQHTGKRRLVVSGILVSVSNPYWTIWWVTIGLAYILQARVFGVTGVIVFFCGHILADFTWYSVVSLSVGRGRAFFSPLFYRILVGACASFLAVFSIWFLAKGVMGLL